MATLPSTASLTGDTITEADFKTAVGNLRTFLADLLDVSGVQNEAYTKLGGAFNSSVDKSAQFTIQSTDIGKIFNCTGSFIIDIPVYTSLLTSFSFTVRNVSTGAITITPNLGNVDKINGATNLVIGPDETVVVYRGTSAASAWRTIGLTNYHYNKIGYSKGESLTQTTSRATTITGGTRATGELTLIAAILNANTSQAITFNSTAIEANDTIIIHRKSTGTANMYQVWIDSVSAGSCVIMVRNHTAGNSPSEQIKLAYTILKGAVA